MPASWRCADHLLELGEREVAVRRVAAVGGEEAERVVAPVVLQALLGQIAVVHEGVDRQELDGRDPERRDVVDDVRFASPA